MTDYNLSESQEMDRRSKTAKRFFDTIFEEEEDHPYFVSDEACLYDIYAGEEEVIIERCRVAFRFQLSKEHFKMPIWRLLDIVFGDDSQRGATGNSD